MKAKSLNKYTGKTDSNSHLLLAACHLKWILLDHLVLCHYNNEKEHCEHISSIAPRRLPPRCELGALNMGLCQVWMSVHAAFIMSNTVNTHWACQCVSSLASSGTTNKAQFMSLFYLHISLLFLLFLTGQGLGLLPKLALDSLYSQGWLLPKNARITAVHYHDQFWVLEIKPRATKWATIKKKKVRWGDGGICL